MTTDDDLKPLAQRIWPQAKEIRITHEGAGVTATGIDVHDRVTGAISADSVDALREKLEHTVPEGGGQAP